MLYLNSPISLSLLLSASSIAVSAAATPPHHDAGNAISYARTLSCEFAHDKRAVFSRVAGLTDSQPDMGSSTQEDLNTTTDVSHTAPSSNASGVSRASSPFDIDLSDPLGNAVDWLDPQQTVNDVWQGALDLVAASDEGPMTVKVGTLGYDEGAEHTPFELWTERETGSLVFLAPTKLAQERGQGTSGTKFSNHSMSMIMARATSLGLLPGFNLNDSEQESAHAAEAPKAGNPITMRIMAEVSVDKSKPKEKLCATYYQNWHQIQDGIPMRLVPCDDTYIPDPSTGFGSSETQLWEYNPSTREVKPLVMGIKSEMILAVAANHSITPEAINPVTTITTGYSVNPLLAVSGSAAALVSSATVESAKMSHSATHTRSPEMTMLSQSKVRRDSNGRTNGYSESTAARKRDASTSSFVAVPIADPYNLVFNPQTGVETGSKLPRPPA